MFTNLVSNLHWLAVLAGTAAYFVLGAVWYSHVLFANQWSKLLNINIDDPDSKKGLRVMMIGSFVLSFIASCGVGILLQILPAGDLLESAKLGLLIGICFSVTSMGINYLYTRKPLMLYMIDGGYHLFGIIVSSVVIKLLS